ncbi:MAG: cohesin domain-containing protein, partial [Verrucomicrobia bacterium]|nr:cohesin domain-containing protein [Verrucomicrobiota bacterium]
MEISSAVAACLVALGVLPLGAQDLRIEGHAVLPGGLVNVPVLVSNVAGLASASLTINYDPQLLSLEGVTNGGLGQPFSIE